MKGETLKIYRALLAFYKATIIPLVRWSFVRGGLHLNPQDLFAPLTVTTDEVLDRITSPEMRLEDLVFPQASETSGAAGQATRRRARMPRPTDFAISLPAYLNALVGTCPLCGHTEVEHESEDDESE
jgi:hypothetical protein